MRYFNANLDYIVGTVRVRGWILEPAIVKRQLLARRLNDMSLADDVDR